MSNQPSKTILGSDSVISGDLTLENDAVIMGQFTGTVRVSGVLELTETAKVNGTIIAGALRHAGKAIAHVVAEHGVELLEGSSLSGRLFATRLSIAEGATYEGEIHVGPEAMEGAQEILDEAETDQPEPASWKHTSPRRSADRGSREESVIGSALGQRRARVAEAADVVGAAVRESADAE